MSTYHDVILFIVDSIGALGYFGVFALMFLESTFFPFPSEVIMIPAGYLISQGEMSFILVMVMSVLGSISGAWVNYYIAVRFGRKMLLKIISEVKLRKVESFFEKHGPISTFNGRLIPIVRQYISFPAGLAKMNPLKFTIYTAAGSIVWSLILVSLGYFLGQNQDLLDKYIKEVILIILLFVVILTVIYSHYKKS